MNTNRPISGQVHASDLGEIYAFQRLSVWVSQLHASIVFWKAPSSQWRASYFLKDPPEKGGRLNAMHSYSLRVSFHLCHLKSLVYEWMVSSEEVLPLLLFSPPGPHPSGKASWLHGPPVFLGAAIGGVW